MDIATDLYSKLRKDTKLIQKKDIARLKGELLIEHGKCRLVLGNKQVLSSQDRALLFLSRVELNSLLMALQKMGMKAIAQHIQKQIDKSFQGLYPFCTQTVGISSSSYSSSTNAKSTLKEKRRGKGNRDTNEVDNIKGPLNIDTVDTRHIPPLGPQDTCHQNNEETQKGDCRAVQE
ncbi:hypothetical protein RND71_017998 [Anisodus tanguticus]|uniref:Uncharacterized protein n=1 Tax=Anisodus tanguticus TaxID=243964 RepID=A0AAE1S3W1_9SOLA|nr:hypothetical protein RND71_017998 [Anisodus tanguticus]